MASVAYFDPGNYATGLQGGSLYGYKLLFVVLLSGLGAILLQIMACRMGIVTKHDLAELVRIELMGRAGLAREAGQFKKAWAFKITLWILWAICEFAIIATDLAELLGSAIALNLLIPGLPLYGGVLLTAADTLVILIAYRPNGGRRSMMLFEFIIVALVIAVFSSLITVIVQVNPDWREVFLGYVPSSTLGESQAIYTAVGILGATVMPHAVFLGSRISTIQRIDCDNSPTNSTAVATTDTEAAVPPKPQSQDSPTVAFARSHLTHATIDVGLSLVTFALTINSAIVILAGATFYFRPDRTDDEGVANLFDAHRLIGQYVGAPAALLFAISLLCSGQSASITATLVGQIVSEGFLEWRTSPFLRRIITRLIAILPSTIVAAVLGQNGIDSLLVGSQVALSIALPFVLGPLVWLSSQKEVMRIWEEAPDDPNTDKKEGTSAMEADPNVSAAPAPQAPEIAVVTAVEPAETAEQPKRTFRKGPSSANGRWVYFTSPLWATLLGWLLFVVVCCANGFVLVNLALGR